MLILGYLRLFLSHQADATHDRVVKKEDGEKLAKVKTSKVRKRLTEFDSNLVEI